MLARRGVLGPCVFGLPPGVDGGNTPPRANPEPKGGCPPMVEYSKLAKMIQEKLTEKEEVIHEQQRQLDALQSEVEKLRADAASIAEKDEVIREQMLQIAELAERIEQLEKKEADSAVLEEKEEVIREQMQQILEYSEKLEKAEADLAEAREQMKEFEALQDQLKGLLGDA